MWEDSDVIFYLDLEQFYPSLPIAHFVLEMTQSTISFCEGV